MMCLRGYRGLSKVVLAPSIGRADWARLLAKPCQRLLRAYPCLILKFHPAQGAAPLGTDVKSLRNVANSLQ